MRTLERILKDENVMNEDDILNVDYEKGAKIYANEQTAKWRELYEAQKKLNDIDNEYNLITMMLESDPNPYSKRYKEHSEQQDKLGIIGNELRQKISDIEKELGLKK